MLHKLLITLILCVNFLTLPLYSQMPPADPPENMRSNSEIFNRSTNQDNRTTDLLNSSYQSSSPFSDKEIIKTLIVIVFGLIVLLAFFIFQAKLPEKATGEFSRNIVITLVVIAILILIMGGFDEQQLAPAFGLLGTIVGFLFGKRS